MKERFQNLLELLSFRTMWDDQEEEEWEELDRRDEYVSGEAYADDTAQRAGIGPEIVYLIIAAMIVIRTQLFLFSM